MKDWRLIRWYRSMKISIVVPCFNEVKTIDTIVGKILSVNVGTSKEIIIVDDGSTDGTKERLELIEKKNNNIRIIYHNKNLGKGAALRSGFKIVTGDVIIIQDADLEYDPNEYSKLLAPIFEDKADVVYGTRFAISEPHRVLYFWHQVGNKIVTLLSNMFTNLNLSDIEVCYKVFKREILDRIELKENRFGFEPEFTAKIAKLKYRIFEVGISYSGRTYKEGKKINWIDGLYAIYVVIRYNLFP